MTAELIPARLGHVLRVARDRDPELLALAATRDADQRAVAARIFEESHETKALCVNGRAIAVYGLFGSMLSAEAIIWLIASRDVRQHLRAFLTACQDENRRLQTRGVRLVAYVEADCQHARRFLERWGFEIGEPLPNGFCRAVQSEKWP